MVYMDLGMSSMQIDAWERGFSYSYDAPLDMRMDPRQSFDAADLVNEWPEARIAQVLRRFGEERHAGGIAREIVARRPLRTTSELVAAIQAGMPASARFGGGHPAKRTFQALRIAVNGELDLLNEVLPLAWDALPLGGRFAAISFHSLEDRPVKQFLAEKATGCVCPPGAAGLRLRPRARGRTPDPARGRARAGGGRGEPALALGPPARRDQDRLRHAGVGDDARAGRTTDGRRRAEAPLRRPRPRRRPRAPRRRSRRNVPATVPAREAPAAPPALRARPRQRPPPRRRNAAKPLPARPPRRSAKRRAAKPP